MDDQLKSLYSDLKAQQDSLATVSDRLKPKMQQNIANTQAKIDAYKAQQSQPAPTQPTPPTQQSQPVTQKQTNVPSTNSRVQQNTQVTDSQGNVVRPDLLQQSEYVND